MDKLMFRQRRRKRIEFRTSQNGDGKRRDESHLDTRTRLLACVIAIYKEAKSYTEILAMISATRKIKREENKSKPIMLSFIELASAIEILDSKVDVRKTEYVDMSNKMTVLDICFFRFLKEIKSFRYFLLRVVIRFLAWVTETNCEVC